MESEKRRRGGACARAEIADEGGEVGTDSGGELELDGGRGAGASGEEEEREGGGKRVELHCLESGEEGTKHQTRSVTMVMYSSE